MGDVIADTSTLENTVTHLGRAAAPSQELHADTSTRGRHGSGTRYDGDRAARRLAGSRRPRRAPPSARATEGTAAVTIKDTMTVSVETVYAALATVKDPEIRRPITELDMVTGLSADPSGVVGFTLLLTIAGCPMRETL